MERHEERAAAIIRAFPRSRGFVLRALDRLRRILRPARLRPQLPAPASPAPSVFMPPSPPRGLASLVRWIMRREQ
jgi:hypothetical protein